MYILPMFRQSGRASCMRYLQWKDQTTAPTKEKKNQQQTTQPKNKPTTKNHSSSPRVLKIRS